MTTAVTLQITSEQQTTGDASPNRSVFTYQGRKTTRGAKIFLVYTASDKRFETPTAPAGNKTTTLLTLSQTEIIMNQTGAVTAKMIFRPGETTAGRYVLAEGTLPLDVYTKSVSFDDAHISLEYQLCCMGEVLSDNRLQIRIIPAY